MQLCVFYTKHKHYKCKWHFSLRVNCVLVLKGVSSLELHKMPMSAGHWCTRLSAFVSRTFIPNMAYWLLKSGYLSRLQLVFLYEWHVEGKTQAKHLGFWAINKRQCTSKWQLHYVFRVHSVGIRSLSSAELCVKPVYWAAMVEATF